MLSRSSLRSILFGVHRFLQTEAALPIHVVKTRCEHVTSLTSKLTSETNRRASAVFVSVGRLTLLSLTSGGMIS